MKSVEDVKEAAAIGFSPGTSPVQCRSHQRPRGHLSEGGGPEELVLFLALSSPDPVDLESLRERCQTAIKVELNPLFKVWLVIVLLTAEVEWVVGVFRV